jgi:acetoin utilization protein AcuB
MQWRRTGVADVMTTQVTTVAPETLVAEAIQLFGECNIRHLLVTDQQGRLAGVFSDRDALRQMARGCDPFATRVAALMRQEPVSVAEDTPIQDAIELLSFHRINCLPVIDADRPRTGHSHDDGPAQHALPHPELAPGVGRTRRVAP